MARIGGRQHRALGQNDFAGPEESEHVCHAFRSHVAGQKTACRDVQERDTPHGLARLHGSQVGGGARHKRLGIEDRAGGDDPRDVPADQPLGGARILHLVADGHLSARVDQSGDVMLDALVRNAAHGSFHVGVLVAGRQGDPEKGGRLAGIVEEHLVEIAHPVQQDGVRSPALHLEILPEHRRYAGRRGTHRLLAYIPAPC